MFLYLGVQPPVKCCIESFSHVLLPSSSSLPSTREGQVFYTQGVVQVAFSLKLILELVLASGPITGKVCDGVGTMVPWNKFGYTGFSFAFLVVAAVFGGKHHKVADLINVFWCAMFVGMVCLMDFGKALCQSGYTGRGHTS